MFILVSLIFKTWENSDAKCQKKEGEGEEKGRKERRSSKSDIQLLIEHAN